MALLTVAEIARELWVYRRMRTGEIPYFENGRIRRVRQVALDAFLERNLVDKASGLDSDSADEVVRRIRGW